MVGMEGNVKAWYASKSVWAGIVVIATGALALAADPSFGLISPEVSLKLIGFINMVAGAVGIRSRVKATRKIG